MSNKTSGGAWRTLQGLIDFAVIQSYLDTATKWGHDKLDALRELFTTAPLAAVGGVHAATRPGAETGLCAVLLDLGRVGDRFARPVPGGRGRGDESARLRSEGLRRCVPEAALADLVGLVRLVHISDTLRE
ncbi:hypothetical protein OG371_23250 [Amycolatopsis sp. NBC_01480]|nr:hypothetical protein [Amycolatopsis sp. NBC_01480]